MKIKLFVLLMIVSLLCACSAVPPEDDSSSAQNGASENSAVENVSGNSQETNIPTEGNSENQGSEDQGTEPDSQSGSSEQTSQGSSGQTSQEQETIIYEKYLAALSMYALVLEYPDFQLDTIYAASFVPMENKAQSKGIYMTFESGGMQLVAHLYPIEAERTESGARNVYSPEVGYAAFDIVSAVPEGLSKLSQSDYADVMDKITLPTVTMY